jgi:hypothetical protein
MWIMWSALANTRSKAFVLAAAALMAGCGDNGTGPSGMGSVQAYVHDEPSSTAGAPARNEGPSPSSHGSGSYSGTLDADAQVSIAGEGGVWVELGPPSSASLDLQASGSGIDLHGDVVVPVGTYMRVRLVLTGAQARMNTGSTIGGISLTASVTMSVGAGGTVVIEKEVPPFEVRADTRTTVHWDMNSEHWVTEENVEDEEVEEPEVEEAAEPWVEEEPGDGQMR